MIDDNVNLLYIYIKIIIRSNDIKNKKKINNIQFNILTLVNTISVYNIKFINILIKKLSIVFLFSNINSSRAIIFINKIKSIKLSILIITYISV